MHAHIHTHIHVLLSQTKERTPAGLNLGSIYNIKCSPLSCPVLVGQNSLAISVFPMPAFPHPPLRMLPIEERQSFSNFYSSLFHSVGHLSRVWKQ